MAFARKKRLKSGRWAWYVIGDDKRSLGPAGVGDDGRELAREWASAVNRRKRYARAGVMLETGCLWTLKDLRKADIEDAKRRGLASLQRRESHWRILLATLGEQSNLDDVTRPVLRRYAEARCREVGPAVVNRDLSVLRRALLLARRMGDESCYTADPFADWQPLNERKVRRQPIVLTAKQKVELLRILRRIHPPMAVEVEIMMLTASRLTERGEVVGGELVYPSQKGGDPRVFPLKGSRLKALLKLPHRWSRRAWRQARVELGISRLTPHHLRHTEASDEFEAGADVAEVQRLLGHKSPAMASKLYIHLRRKPIKRRA